LDTIYVALLNEGTRVWAPVDAERVRDDVWRILNCRGEDETEFPAGSLVWRRHQKLSNGEFVVAFEAVQ